MQAHVLPPLRSMGRSFSTTCHRVWPSDGAMLVVLDDFFPRPCVVDVASSFTCGGIQP